jgi:hypothetical protein
MFFMERMEILLLPDNAPKEGEIFYDYYYEIFV